MTAPMPILSCIIEYDEVEVEEVVVKEEEGGYGIYSLPMMAWA